MIDPASTIEVKAMCERCEGRGCDQCDNGIATSTVTLLELARLAAWIDAAERAARLAEQPGGSAAAAPRGIMEP